MHLQSVNDITPDHRHIFVSPHFDDVAYSCGGTIGTLVNNGERPLVMTVFAGIPSFTFNPLTIASKAGRPLGFRVHRGMGFNLSMSLSPAKVMTLRRQEDAHANDYLQAEYLWLDYLDGIYRSNARRYANLQQLLGGEVHPDDLEISQRLSQDLVKVHERLAGITWYLPLGVGRHVDHQLVSAAAHGLIERGAGVKFYEDFPYAAKEGALHERLLELGGDFTPTRVEIGGVLSLRIEASALYASQIKMSFGDRNTLFKAIKDYAWSILPTETAPLERYWSPV